MKESGNYPLGAEHNPNAPYNQPLDVEHERFVSVILSYNTTVTGPENMSEECIEEEIKDEIYRRFRKDYNIDEITIIKE